MGLTFNERSIKAAPSGMIMEGSGVNLLNIYTRGIEDLIKTLNRSLPQIITMRQANILINIGIDLLARALPRTPYATGQLRESGEATVRLGRRKFRVAKGNADGTVGVISVGITKETTAQTRTMGLDVSFSRFEDGVDIAQWTHEIIYAYEERPSRPAARKPNTGPKYLEIPFNERVDDYFNALTDMGALEADIRAARRVKRAKLGVHDVDMIELVAEKISFSGYYNV